LVTEHLGEGAAVTTTEAAAGSIKAEQRRPHLREKKKTESKTGRKQSKTGGKTGQDRGKKPIKTEKENTQKNRENANKETQKKPT
jgi:hypothetical protein